MDRANLSVGQVAKRCNVQVSALHFYESKGLIHSHRNAGNQRRYSADVIRRVSLIKAAQKMGISLAEVEQALFTLPKHRAPTQLEWESMSRQWQQQLDQRILYLQRLRNYLSGCIGCGCLSMKSCPLYNPQDMMGEHDSGPVLIEREPTEMEVAARELLKNETES